MPKPMTIAAILLSLLSQAGSSSLSSPQSHHKPSRDESTKAIRATAYSMMKAFLTQDVATFKRLSAKRTLQLVSLTFEAAREDSQYKQELQNAHITNADQFLGYFLQGMANPPPAAPLTIRPSLSSLTPKPGSRRGIPRWLARGLSGKSGRSISLIGSREACLRR
jgi:hypothetical protein